MTQNKNMTNVSAPSQLPKTVETALSEGGRAMPPSGASRKARWLTLNHLPGFMRAGIRAMGESVFLPLTSTRLSCIEVIANMPGLGPHLQHDIDLTANQLRNTVRPSNIFEYSSEQMAQLFGATYQAQAVQFDDVDFTYFLVRDPMGSYIYRWPSAETKPRLPCLEVKPAQVTANAQTAISGARPGRFLR